MLEHSQEHTYYPHTGEGIEDEDGEDVLVEENEYLIETIYCNGTNEVVKKFNQNCVICYERDSVYSIRKCSHQCFCEPCYQKKGYNDISKGIVCRT